MIYILYFLFGYLVFRAILWFIFGIEPGDC